MGSRIVVYTALTGAYEDLNQTGDFQNNRNIDYVCFTDTEVVESQNWDIQVIQSSLDPVLLSRAIKMMQVFDLPDGTIAIYKDNSVTLRGPIQEMVNCLLRRADIAFMHHSSRRTILNEFIACEVFSKDKSSTIRNQFRFLLKEDFYGVKAKPLWGGLFILRVNPATRAFLKSWYSELVIRSCRDQLSLRYALKMNQLTARELILSNVESEWHLWPVKLNRVKKDGRLSKHKWLRRTVILSKYLKSGYWYYWVWFFERFSRINWQSCKNSLTKLIK